MSPSSDPSVRFSRTARLCEKIVASCTILSYTWSMSSRAAEIVQKLGGTRPLAAALRLPVSTVQSWKRAGQIPARHQEAVLPPALALRVALSPEAFFDPQVVERARVRTPPAKKQSHHSGRGEHGERSLRFAAQPQSAHPF